MFYKLSAYILPFRVWVKSLRSKGEVRARTSWTILEKKDEFYQVVDLVYREQALCRGGALGYQKWWQRYQGAVILLLQSDLISYYSAVRIYVYRLPVTARAMKA